MISFGGKNPSTDPQRGQILFQSQLVALPYLVTALLLFGSQVFVATAGSLEFILPDLPAPVAFHHGRAVHLNLSIFWPLMGLMGGVFYILPEEVGAELHSPKLARVQFWLFSINLVGLLTSLALGATEGREYLEAPSLFDAGILLVVTLFAYNVVLTLARHPVTGWRPTWVGLVLGLFFSTVFFVPSMFNVKHIVFDEIIKFWVVHIWVESTVELVIASLIAALLVSMTTVDRTVVEKWYYVEAFLVVLTGLLGTGHHYFWIGVPEFWLYVGGIFGALQVVPLFFLVSSAYQATKQKTTLTTNRLAFYFLWAAVFWNFTGAGLLGLVMTIPSVNAYVHGTHLTSSHGHLALFGTYGFLTIAVAYFVLPRWRPGIFNLRWGMVSFWLINLGLAIMGGSLIIAGILQAYLHRMFGLDFLAVNQAIIPYMWVRTVGGVIFGAGGVIPSADLFRNLIWPTVRNRTTAVFGPWCSRPN